jgi:NAD(P)H-hydrate epimerase
MKLLTAQEMRTLEQAAAERGWSYENMMERAGLAVAEYAREACPQGVSQVLVLVGPGNNGGDGLVAARYLDEWGIGVTVYVWRREASPDHNLARIEALDIPIIRADRDPDHAGLAQLTAEADVIIDALLGAGARGPLRDGLAELLTVVRTVSEQRRAARPRRQHVLPLAATAPCRRPLVIAVDMPSGLDADTGSVDPRALLADVTITFAHPKRGLMAFPGAAFAGELVVADIGLAPELAQDAPINVITAADVARMLPERSSQSHKGSFGSALILGGSSNYVGAPCLAALAAYRGGAGLVTLAIPAAIHGPAASLAPEATHLLLPHSLGALVTDALNVVGPEMSRYQALLVGPGLGRDARTAALLADLLAGERGIGHRPIGFGARIMPVPRYVLPPLILDADGLNLLAEMPSWPTRLPPETILTPHPGEMARLCGQTVADVNATRIETASKAARDWGCVVVLKGAFTVVAAPDGQTWVNPCATAALATAGSGDVLAGVIVGLRAQGCGALEAALCGVYLHGLAGMLWSDAHGQAGMLASDLLTLLPEARTRVLSR